MTMRLLPCGVLLSLLAATPSYATIISCASLLSAGVDAPIPASFTEGKAIRSIGGNQESLDLLANHAASVAIPGMLGAYVALRDTVSLCLANGCEAVVYVTSNGIGAVSTPFGVACDTMVHVWDYKGEVYDQVPWPDIFVRNWIGLPQQILAHVATPSRGIDVYWAGADEVVEDVARWLSGGDVRDPVADGIVGTYLTIPLFVLSEGNRATPYSCLP